MKLGEKSLGSERTAYTPTRSRIGDLPVLMSEPAGADGQGDHDTGARQVRALFVSAGNPVLWVPDGDDSKRRCAGST